MTAIPVPEIVPSPAPLPADPYPPLYYKDIIPDALFRRVVNRLMKDHGKTLRESETILDGFLGFLKLCGDHPNHHFSPSKLVDLGWHTFLLYTREYAATCEEVAGMFVHHVPHDDPDANHRGSVGETIAFMLHHRILFNGVVWPECHEAGCGCDTCADCETCSECED